MYLNSALIRINTVLIVNNVLADLLIHQTFFCHARNELIHLTFLLYGMSVLNTVIFAYHICSAFGSAFNLVA